MICCRSGWSHDRPPRPLARSHKRASAIHARHRPANRSHPVLGDEGAANRVWHADKFLWRLSYRRCRRLRHRHGPTVGEAHMSDDMKWALAKLDNNQADVLDALHWWVRGFNAAVASGHQRTPNTNALHELPHIIRTLVRLRDQP